MRKKISFFIALAAMMITVAAVWYAHRPFTPKQASWKDVMAEAKAGGYRIITTKELRDRYQTAPSNLFLVDTRQEWEYRPGTGFC